MFQTFLNQFVYKCVCVCVCVCVRESEWVADHSGDCMCVLLHDPP